MTYELYPPPCHSMVRRQKSQNLSYVSVERLRDARKYKETNPRTNLEEEKCKFYLGLTENTFFERHKLHKTSFNNPSYSGSTSLSSFVWELKRLGISYEINFSIVKLAKSYSRESKVCDLCLTEKTEIMLADHQDHFSSLNKRSEIMAKCRHRAKHLLFKW